MKNITKKNIPKSLKSIRSWRLSRRGFIKGSIALGIFSQVGFLESCLSDKDQSILTQKQRQILLDIQNILFPKDDLGPGAFDFNAHNYVLWVLNDKRMDPEENAYLINGLKWTDETAEEKFEKKFLKLQPKEKVQLIEFIATETWGESWLSVMLTLIFEAMISDPIYGFNSEEIGWRWLEHQAGHPRPTKKTMYDAIFTTVKNNG